MKKLLNRLKAEKLFSMLTEKQLHTVLEHSKICNAEAGDVVFPPDEPITHYLVIVDGELGCERQYTNADGQQEFRRRVLKGCEAEGEIAVLTTAGRGCTASALTPLRYMLIEGDLIDVFLGWNQQVSRAIVNDPELTHRAKLVKQVNVFHQLPLENIQAAFKRMSTIEVGAGNTVVNEGDSGDCYYVIETGTAEVWRTDPFTDETKLVAEFGPGDAFGEEALLQNALRNATVKMTSPGSLLVLQKSDFDELVQPKFLQEVEADVARDMVDQGKAKWLDCRYEMEYEESRIPNAPLIPLDRIRENTHKLDSDSTYIVYCRSGRRSKAGAFLLRERNIKALSMIGGIANWPFEIDAEAIDLTDTHTT